MYVHSQYTILSRAQGAGNCRQTGPELQTFIRRKRVEILKYRKRTLHAHSQLQFAIHKREELETELKLLKKHTLLNITEDQQSAKIAALKAQKEEAIAEHELAKQTFKKLEGLQAHSKQAIAQSLSGLETYKQVLDLRLNRNIPTQSETSCNSLQFNGNG